MRETFFYGLVLAELKAEGGKDEDEDERS